MHSLGVKIVIIPEVINNFNVYNDNSKKLVGVTSEVTLPDFSSMTATLDGAGFLGEMDVPVPGHFGSMEQEIPFKNLYTDIFSLFKVGATVALTLRGSMQILNSSSGSMSYVPLKISFKGYTKKLTPGKVKSASTMDSSITLELSYIHIEINNVSMLKLDKLNNVFVIDGKDQLAAINKQC